MSPETAFMYGPLAVIIILIIVTMAVIEIHGRYFVKKESSKPRKFTIEHYPLINRYYPKYNGCLIHRCASTDIWKQRPLDWPELQFGAYGNTEEQALSMIEEFSEQVLKKNVVTKTVILVEDSTKEVI